MQKWQQWETAGEAAWGVALQRETVIRPLAEQRRPSAGSVAEAACQFDKQASYNIRRSGTETNEKGTHRPNARVLDQSEAQKAGANKQEPAEEDGR
jgi:hypothetical protein